MSTDLRSADVAAGRRLRRSRSHALRALLLLCMGLGCLPWASAAHTRSVLVLYSNGRLLPANVEFDRGLYAALAAHPEAHVDVSAEFLDAPKFSGAAYGNTIARYLRDKYGARPPEVIIAGGEEALHFLLQHRAEVFSNVPVVYQSVTVGSLLSLSPLPQDVIGAPIELDFAGTVEQALRWHKSARRLVLVTGVTDWDREWEARLRREAAPFEGRVTLEFISGLSSDALSKRLGELDADSVVFTPGFFGDGAGRPFVPREAARLIAAATAAPVYGPYPTFIGTGVVGGSMASYVAMGRLAADAVLALLAGSTPAAVKLPKTLPNQFHVDWRQARRFGIAPEKLPGDAVVSFKEPSFWEAYGFYVAIASAVMVVQSGLIAALLLERRRRRRTASALAQSELRMSLAAQAARLSMWSLDLGGKEQRRTTPQRRSTDPSAGSFFDFREALADVHPQDQATVQRAIDHALASGDAFDVEYRVATPGQPPRWMAARGRAALGNSQHLLGVALDITPRKRAEEQAEQDRAALRHMTRVSLLGQLSASIAHQLNQPLASILSNAEAAQTMLRREQVDLNELREICNDIVAEDHRAADVIRRLGALFKRGEPQLLPLDVNDLVRDTLDLARTNLLTRHVTPTVELAAELPPIDGDRVQLQQLLLNLIVNAADAMDATPQAERRLSISTSLSEGRAAICVADRGPGIAAADVHKIFDPFWSTKDGGMGIGLAICRSIAEAHRGGLSSRNGADGGAVFCVELPIRSEP